MHFKTLMAAGAALLSVPQMANAVLIGGIDFPQGAISFADSVVSYEPGFGGGAVPTAAHQGTFNALGVPNYAGNNTCASQVDCTFVSLGDGGRIVLRFTDNVLTGSGTNAFDLYVFEVGPDVEDTFVDISKDGVTWLSVGSVSGSTRGVDLDAFGYGTSSVFRFVRLTDNGALDGQSGPTVGADIDAVGAISTRAAVPEPALWAMMIGGFGGVGAAMRRRKRVAVA